MLFSFVVFALANLGPLCMALAIVQGALPRGPLYLRCAALGVVWYGLILAIFHLLSAFGLLTPVPMGVAGLLGLLFLPSRRGMGELSAWGSRLADSLRAYATPRWNLPLLILPAILVLVTVARGLLMPPLAWDSLTYHLVFAGKWVQSGGVVPFSAPDNMDGYSHYPLFGEVLPAWFMAPFHGDLLVNLASQPFLALLVVSLVGLAREAGLDRPRAILYALCIFMSPMVFAYLNTSYVDIQVTAFLLTALLFLWRWRRERDPILLVGLYLCLGFALGTKLTSLYTIGLLSGMHLVLALAGVPRGSWPRRALPVLGGLCLILAVGGWKYLQNLVETGNPIYPYGLKLLGRQLFQDSGFIKFYSSLQDPLTRWQDLQNLTTLVSYSPLDLPTTAGPKYILLALAAVLPLLFSAKVRSQRWLWGVLGLAVVPLLLFYTDGSPNSVLTRRLWLLSTPRFLTVPLAVLALLGMVNLQHLGLFNRWVIGAICVFLLMDANCVNYSFLFPGSGALTLGALLGLLGLCGLLWWLRRRLTRPLLVIALSLMALTPVPLLKVLDAYRHENRWLYYSYYIDLHSFPREFVEGWAFVDRQPEKKVIALTAGYVWPGHNWYFYPLLGGRLQHEAVYVPVNHRGVRPTHADNGLLRTRFDYEIWNENLELQEVDWIFVQEPRPPELDWMLGHPERFKLVREGQYYRIFEVIRGGQGSAGGAAPGGRPGTRGMLEGRG